MSLKGSATSHLCIKPLEHIEECQPHNQRGALSSLEACKHSTAAMGHIKGVLLGAFIINAGEYGRARGQLTSSTLACYFGSKGIVQQRGREQPQKGERRKKITRLGTSTDNSQKSTNSQPLVVHNTHATPCSDSTRHMPPQCE